MSDKILFVDLDRTLFDTDRFIRGAWQTIEKDFQINIDNTLAEVEAWYEYFDDLRTYRFDKHVEHVTGRPVAEIARRVRPVLETQEFAYPDSKELFTWQASCVVRILTFGEPWWQNFKLSFVPQFRDVPADITLERKGEFIAARFPGASGWLVDDRRGEQLPDGFVEIWLDRSSKQSISHRNGTITINSLKSVQEVL